MASVSRDYDTILWYITSHNTICMIRDVLLYENTAWDFGVKRKITDKVRELNPFSSGEKPTKTTEVRNNLTGVRPTYPPSP